MRKILLTILLSVIVQGFVLAQVWDKTNGCITDTLKDTEPPFTRFTTEPMFKGNMKWFLTKNISLDIFLYSMQPIDTVFADTARFQFLMSKKGEISNVTISKVKSPIFQAEVMRLFRLSSCSWQMGDQGGRYVNGWAQFEIYFRLTRKYGEIKLNVDYKQLVPVNYDYYKAHYRALFLWLKNIIANWRRYAAWLSVAAYLCNRLSLQNTDTQPHKAILHICAIGERL